MKDEKFKIQRSNNRISEQDGGKWHDGEVVTPHGIVSVLAQGDDENHHLTRLDFSHQGTFYIRTFLFRFKPRRIVTLANRFAKEITKGKI